MTERNVRAYRSRGLIRPPRMRGRIGYYSQEHLAQLRLIQALLGRGLSLTVIAQLVDRGVAHTELARLVREELPPGGEVPLSTAVAQVLEEAEPGISAGSPTSGSAAAPRAVTPPTRRTSRCRTCSWPWASRTLTSRASASAPRSARHALAGRLPSLELDRRPAGSQGASRTATRRPSDEDVRACAVELASTAFRLALTAALERRASARVSAPER